MVKGRTTIDSRAASVGIDVTAAGRLEMRRYQLAAAITPSAPIPVTNDASADCFFGSGDFPGGFAPAAGFACAGLPTSSE